MAAQIRSRIVHNAWLFPLVASVAWFLTLSILLVHWLASGRPTYPGQSNPYVAFISDIAAFDLKPVFVVGSTITAITYFANILSVNYLRYSDKIHTRFDAAKWRKALSVLAVVASTGAAISLLLLTGFDTVRAHERHKILLLSTFGNLGLSAILTSIVWSDQLRRQSDATLRRWCIGNTILVALSTILGIAFVVLLSLYWFRTAGFFEWTITYLGAFWLASFVGFLRSLPSASDSPRRDENQPLLS